MRPVSVVVTVRNEVDSITRLVEALIAGTRSPDEIVVTDAGSDDGTWDALVALADRNPVVRPIRREGNRSEGRNAAIEAAGNDVIACIDGGCTPRPEWLAEIADPFEHGASWVGGFYLPVGSVREQSIGVTMVFTLAEALAGGFIPSARSMAFTRDAWRAAGGFPVNLVVSEDTAFDEALEAAGYEMVFRAAAVVEWIPPSRFRDQARVIWAWSKSDGEAGIRSVYYRRELRFVAFSAMVGVAAGLVDWRLVPLGLVFLIALMVIHTRHKYTAVAGGMRFVWIPIAWGVGLTARLFGFLAGYVSRRRRTKVA